MAWLTRALHMLEVTGGNVNDCSLDMRIASNVRSQNVPGGIEFPDFM